MNTELDAQLRAALLHAYDNAPAVKERFDQAGIRPEDIDGVADLVKVPVLPKDELIARQTADPPFGGFLAVPLDQVSHIFFSPGPLYEPGAPPDDRAWDVGVMALERAGFVPGDVVLNSLSYHLTPAGFLFDQALNRLGCTVVPGGVGNSDLQLKMMRDLSCTGYIGTASFLMSLIMKAEEAGHTFQTDYQVTKSLVTAEPLPPSLRQTLNEYGISVANAYGTAEFGMMAVDTGTGVPLAMQLLAEPIIEIVNPAGQPAGPGEAGEVVATNFSRVYPMIRLGTGDMAINVDPNPGQSRQEERSIILVGRSGDAVKVRGMFVHPNQLRFAAGQIDGVRAIQGVVSRPELSDRFVIRVDLETPAPGDIERTTLGQAIMETVRTVCRVRVDEVEFVAGSLADDAPGMVDERDWQS